MEEQILREVESSGWPAGFARLRFSYLPMASVLSTILLLFAFGRVLFGSFVEGCAGSG